MDIIFNRAKDGELANNPSKLSKKYRGNDRRIKLIRRRLDELRAADNLGVIAYFPAPHCHELRGNRKGQLAVSLDAGCRMIFEPANNPIPRKEDGGLDWNRVTIIRILELSEDYHD